VCAAVRQRCVSGASAVRQRGASALHQCRVLTRVMDFPSCKSALNCAKVMVSMVPETFCFLLAAAAAVALALVLAAAVLSAAAVAAAALALVLAVVVAMTFCFLLAAAAAAVVEAAAVLSAERFCVVLWERGNSDVSLSCQ